VILYPASAVWSALFFLMLVTLALSTMFPTTENIATSVIDQFAHLFRPYKFWVTLSMCFLLMLLGIPLTTNGGMYLLQLMDAFGVGYALLLLGLVEILVVAWLYGAERLLDNVESMIGYRPWKGWIIVWKFITPGLLLFAIFFTITQLRPLTYGPYTYPTYMTYIGCILTLISLGPIPGYAIYYFIYEWRRTSTNATGLYKIITVLKNATATDENKWHPALVKHQLSDIDIDGIRKDDDDVFA